MFIHLEDLNPADMRHCISVLIYRRMLNMKANSTEECRQKFTGIIGHSCQIIQLDRYTAYFSNIGGHPGSEVVFLRLCRCR